MLASGNPFYRSGFLLFHRIRIRMWGGGCVKIKPLILIIENSKMLNQVQHDKKISHPEFNSRF